MKLVHPIWLFISLIVSGGLFWSWRNYDGRQMRALSAFASAHLLPQLTTSLSVMKRRWRRGLFLASLLFICLALSEPQIGFHWEEVTQRGVEIMFAVDTSRSMLTPDVKPDRLTRVKLAMDDFVNHLEGDGVGLVAFAGTAFLQCPITTDYEAFHETLAALDTQTIPRGGTNISSAIRETQAAMQNHLGSQKILLLLTDGEDLEGNAVEAATTAAKEGWKIYTVGVGTIAGDLIPISTEDGPGFLKDDSGQLVRSRLDETGLKKIAEATGGFYIPLGSQGEGLEAIYQKAIAPLAKHDFSSRRQKIYSERYQWPLALGLVCLLASWLVGTRKQIKSAQSKPVLMKRPSRPPAVTLVGLFLLSVLTHFTQASEATAEKSYQSGDYTKAEDQFDAAAKKNPNKPELAFNAGTAAYKAGDYTKAVDSFLHSLGQKPSSNPERLASQEDTFYNLGNTLYRTGQKNQKSDPQQTMQNWAQALKTYDAALQLRSDDADAKYNRDFVQRKLDELKKKNPQPNSPDPKQKDQKDQANQDSSAGLKSGQDSKSDQEAKPDQDQSNKSAGQSGQSSPEEQGNQTKDAKSTGGTQPSNQKTGLNPPMPAGETAKASPTSPASGKSPNQAVADQKKSTDVPPSEPRLPGEMSKEEAKNLLDSVKDEERRYPTSPVSRSNDLINQPDRPLKDW